MKSKKVVKKVVSMFLMTMVLMAFLTFVSNAQTSDSKTGVILEESEFVNDATSFGQANGDDLIQKNIKSDHSSKVLSCPRNFMTKKNAIFASQVLAPKYGGKIAPSIPEIKAFNDRMEEIELIEASTEPVTEEPEEIEEITFEAQTDTYTEESTGYDEEDTQTEIVEESSEDVNYEENYEEDYEESYNEDEEEVYEEDADYSETALETNESESEIENFDEETEVQEETYSNSNYSEEEIDLIARTTYQEAGSCNEYCQWLVASTILNLAEANGGIRSVVFNYNIFNVAYCLYNDTPSDLSYSVARRVASGDRDYNVMAFRTDYYHDFGTPYKNEDNVYFSEY